MAELVADLPEPHETEFIVSAGSDVNWPARCVTCGVKDWLLVALRPSARELVRRTYKSETYRTTTVTVRVPQCRRCRTIQRWLTAQAIWIPGWTGVAFGLLVLRAVADLRWASQNIVTSAFIVVFCGFVCYLVFAESAYQLFRLWDRRLGHLLSPLRKVAGEINGASHTGILGCHISVNGRGCLGIVLSVQEYADAFKEANPKALRKIKSANKGGAASTKK